MIMIAKNYIEFRFRLFWDTLYTLTLNKPSLLTPSHSRGGGGGVSTPPPSDLGRGATEIFVNWNVHKPCRDE